MGPRSGSGGLGGMFPVEGGLGFKHGASDSEEPIGDAAQGAAMAMTALAQFRVAGAAARIVLDGDTGPMIDGGAQPQMAGLTHEDDAALAAASRHRSDAGQSAQRMIISFAQRFRGLAEQRGEDDPSDARQGSQDRHVALLGFLPRRIFLSAFSELVGEFVEPSMRLLYLLVHQFEARRHGGDVGGRCFDRATGDNERLLAQDAQDLGRLEAANAMGFQQAHDAAFAQADGLGGCRRQYPQIEEPIGGEIVTQFERLRIIAPELLADAVGKPVALLAQVLGHARPLAQLDHDRVFDCKPAKAMPVGSQRVAEHVGVPAVVFGAGDGEAIAEAVALGEKLDLPRDPLLDTLSKTAVVAPAHAGKLATAKKNDYTPQFPIRLMHKDFGLILTVAAPHGLFLPVTVAAAAVNSAEADSGIEEDFSAVIRRMEQEAGAPSILQPVA